MLRKTVLITDLDNTLYDWFKIWYESFNSMLEKVIEISGIEKNVLLEEIKAIHQKHGTAEYAFLLQDIPSLQKLYGDKDKILREMDSAIHAYNSARKQNLKLYDTVEDTLKELKKRGVIIVGYTESKSYYSAYRMKRLMLDKYMDILYSPPDHEIPEGEGKNTKFDFELTVHRHTPEGELKPNPKLLLDIVNGIGADPEECVYIGDSEMKDISMAKKAGIADVYAAYGNGHFNNGDEGPYNLLRAVTFWTEEVVERERRIKEENAGEITPTFSVDQFSEILDLFNFEKFTK